MNYEFIDALEQIEKEKGISKDILFEAIEAALISAYKKNFNTAPNVKVSIDRDSGEIKVFSCLTIVEDVKDSQQELSLAEARAISSKYQAGDIVDMEVTPKNFGRIAAQTAKQVVIQRIREAEREIIYREYVDREDDIVTGIVQRADQKNIIIDLGKAEAILAPSEQMPNETYKQGDRIKTYVVEVKKTTKGPQILVSRTHPGLLKRLFELEVPEIFDGTVEIKSIAREAGFRSKAAVFSRNHEVDPVGSCVGPKGVRVQTIVTELKGEKIDIIKWSEEPKEFVSNALSPAKVTFVEIKEDKKIAGVVVPDYQLSLAIGKEGQNARLAAKLTGWKIDINSESQVKKQLPEEMDKDPQMEEAVLNEDEQKENQEENSLQSDLETEEENALDTELDAEIEEEEIT
ncbi:transcription termination factor NusA [Candidatus Contubernalis alkaliaceticus]|uniref:transcription termination factor NusA n=1 Tax=Candidatus Contubernalis alkaliaceticus TaxID=338645 RepID=UPI001F4C2B9A|nr:transcription termination factor NusA [Candidatus Contubernalis alkalaceticus]UNC91834.1 transcription termination/antitermination protein NusA [Candidatus Contubernalis alkalaceticus]